MTCLGRAKQAWRILFTMKSETLAKANPYLKNKDVARAGLWRSVVSSSAIEGIFIRTGPGGPARKVIDSPSRRKPLASVR
jgi:hypothetical protein